MADIKQAAKWMQEGHKVVRKDLGQYATPLEAGLDAVYWWQEDSMSPATQKPMMISDLLSEHWELAD